MKDLRQYFGILPISLFLIAAPAIMKAAVVTNVTISGTVNLTTPLLDPVLLYDYVDGSGTTTYGVAPLTPIVSGVQLPLPTGLLPFSQTVPAHGSIPAGFVSGELTIMGLYGSSGGVMMVFDTAMYSAIINSSGAVPYTNFFPSPSEATLAGLIATNGTPASQTALEKVFAANLSYWVPFTLSTTNYVTGAVEFSAGQNGGSFAIAAVTPAAVPEPSTLMLLGLGLPLFAGWRKLRR